MNRVFMHIVLRKRLYKIVRSAILQVCIFVMFLFDRLLNIAFDIVPVCMKCILFQRYVKK